jgi:hypothetical protein
VARGSGRRAITAGVWSPIHDDDDHKSPARCCREDARAFVQQLVTVAMLTLAESCPVTGGMLPSHASRIYPQNRITGRGRPQGRSPRQRTGSAMRPAPRATNTLARPARHLAQYDNSALPPCGHSRTTARSIPA